MDFDKLHELANNHRNLRLMLGHGKFNWNYYNYSVLQTINDFWLRQQEDFKIKVIEAG